MHAHTWIFPCVRCSVLLWFASILVSLYSAVVALATLKALFSVGWYWINRVCGEQLWVHNLLAEEVLNQLPFTQKTSIIFINPFVELLAISELGSTQEPNRNQL